MLIPFADVEPFLRAPGHPSVPVRACAASGSPHFTAFHPGQAVPRIFPVTNGQPVMIDFEQSVASPGWFTGAETYTFSMKRRRQWPRQLKGVLIGTAEAAADDQPDDDSNARPDRACDESCFEHEAEIGSLRLGGDDVNRGAKV